MYRAEARLRQAQHINPTSSLCHHHPPWQEYRAHGAPNGVQEREREIGNLRYSCVLVNFLLFSEETICAPAGS